MKLFGYIEGYYGRELSGVERRRIIDRLSEQGLNSYLLGSKEDPWHRVHWKNEPPLSYFEELTSLILYGKERGVVIIPAVAPGLSYNFDCTDDEEALIGRIKAFESCGAEKMALLMDDLPLELPESAKSTGLSLGQFHGQLISRITNSIPSGKMIFCPTLYTNELLGTGGESDTYLLGLHSSMPESISVFWTGKNTIAETIDPDSCQTVTSIFGDRVIFWDNYYANDYATTRLFVGPFDNRDHHFITESSGGIMINPTGMIETDLMILDLFGKWYRNGDSTELDWMDSAKRAGVPESFYDYLPWFRSPFSFPSLTIISEENLQPLPFFNSYLVQWQSNLKREWYPYLHRFFTELKLRSGKVGTGPWYEQRFYPWSASRLKDRTSEESYSVL